MYMSTMKLLVPVYYCSTFFTNVEKNIINITNMGNAMKIFC